jgi:hypothetical protein
MVAANATATLTQKLKPHPPSCSPSNHQLPNDFIKEVKEVIDIIAVHGCFLQEHQKFRNLYVRH